MTAVRLEACPAGRPPLDVAETYLAHRKQATAARAVQAGPSRRCIWTNVVVKPSRS